MISLYPNQEILCLTGDIPFFVILILLDTQFKKLHYITEKIYWTKRFYMVYRWAYFLHYPLEKELVSEIYLKFHKEAGKLKLKQIKKIRFNNILVVLWSNSGSVFSLSLATLSFILSLKWIFVGFLVENYYHYVIVFIVQTGMVLLISPILLRRIIDHLPSETYANISLSNLNQSEVITFVSLKYWELCNDFTHLIQLPYGLKGFLNEKTNFTTALDYYHHKGGANNNVIDSLSSDLKTLWNSANEFKTQKYKKISNCKALKSEATLKLNILPIEFSHHITKFSPYMFEVRLFTLIYSIESLLQLVKEFRNDPKFEDNFMDGLNLIQNIIAELKGKRRKYLFQLIAYDDIHYYIIGLASVTSTSRSLAIFARGLSNLLIEPPYGVRSKYKYPSFKALLHRSKAHYGFDLLISLENFYAKSCHRNNYKRIPKLLKYFKADNQGLDVEDYVNDIKKIGEHLLSNSRESMNRIIKLFNPQFKKHLKSNKDHNLYVMIFGYSKMVRNVLRENHQLIKDYKVKIFVMKEDDDIMLDTRILRYELNHKLGAQIRNTFTGSDDFFKNLLNRDDKLIIMAGAEAFDIKEKRLFHTNNYQKRVEKMVHFFNTKLKNNKPSFWIIAEEYKIYENFPNGSLETRSMFGNELFADHYDKVDVYNLNDMGVEVKLFGEYRRDKFLKLLPI